MRTYNASRTIAEFFACDKMEQLILGPIGSGKTTGVLMKILTLAHQQTPNANGERKTRWGVVRNTKPQLKDSVLKTVFDWLPPDGRRIIWKEQDATLELRLPLPDGTLVRCELLFRALDDERDARRLLSVEYTGVWFSEFREIPLQLRTDALSRTGRYPSKSDGGCTWHGLLGESNMPVRGSDWHEYIEVDPPERLAVFKQPSGLSPYVENIENLPDGYYENLLAGASERWIQAHVLCEYPDSLDGKIVYANTFRRDVHVAKQELRPIPGTVVLMGIDQGRNPAAAFMQLSPKGQLIGVGETFGLDISMETFAAEHLRPYVASRFGSLPILAVTDPAAFTRNDTNDVTPADILRKYGFQTHRAPTNDLNRRLEAVEKFMLRGDGLLLCPVHCKRLIAGMASEYRFKLKSNGDAEPTPEKKHPVSDLQDALQYVALLAGGYNYGRVISTIVGANRRPQQAPPPVRGWA